MKIEKQTAIIGGIFGFALGVVIMMIINLNKETRLLKEINRLKIQESYLETYYNECENCLLYTPCEEH